MFISFTPDYATWNECFYGVEDEQIVMRGVHFAIIITRNIEIRFIINTSNIAELWKRYAQIHTDADLLIHLNKKMYKLKYHAQVDRTVYLLEHDTLRIRQSDEPKTVQYYSCEIMPVRLLFKFSDEGIYYWIVSENMQIYNYSCLGKFNQPNINGIYVNRHIRDIYDLITPELNLEELYKNCKAFHVFAHSEALNDAETAIRRKVIMFDIIQDEKLYENYTQVHSGKRYYVSYNYYISAIDFYDLLVDIDLLNIEMPSTIELKDKLLRLIHSKQHHPEIFADEQFSAYYAEFYLAAKECGYLNAKDAYESYFTFVKYSNRFRCTKSARN